MKQLKELWIWLDGKKTSLAASYWVLSQSLVPVWYPDGAPELSGKIILSIGIFLTSVGLGHKVIKNKP